MSKTKVSLKSPPFPGNIQEIVHHRDHREGLQVIWKFDNGYGASLINHKTGSYDWELAVMKGDKIVDNTPVSGGGIVPYIDVEKDLSDLLEKIKAL